MCPIRTDARSCAASLKRLPHILPTPQGLCPMNCAYQTQNHCEARTVGGCWRAVQLGLQLGCTVFVPCAGAMELNLHRTVQGAQPPNARKQVLTLVAVRRLTATSVGPLHRFGWIDLESEHAWQVEELERQVVDVYKSAPNPQQRDIVAHRLYHGIASNQIRDFCWLLKREN